MILKRFPFVAQAAFLGMPDPKLNERNAIAVTLQANHQNKQEAVREIKRVFAKNKIPVDSIYFVDKIPMDPRHHSKVEYAALRDELIKNGVQDALA